MLIVDTCGIIYVLRLITSASRLTTLTPCYIIQMPALLARDESQQPSRRNGAGFVLPSEEMMDFNATNAKRFWSKVGICNENECWHWKAFTKPNNGYGAFRIGGSVRLAHIIAYQLVNGSIQQGMKVLHSCDNPSCCNPKHLSLGTQLDNIHDRDSKGRQAKGEKSGRAKLTESQVVEIRCKYGNGQRTHHSLALEYGVADTTIAAACQRITWSHI